MADRRVAIFATCVVEMVRPKIIDATARTLRAAGYQATSAPGVTCCGQPAANAGAPLPVLVWLHTGGFQAANANFAASDGARFAAERNAIVVAPNYRIGPLGFLGHREFTREDANYPSSGNYGLADQRAALRWVRDHIADAPHAVIDAGDHLCTN